MIFESKNEPIEKYLNFWHHSPGRTDAPTGANTTGLLMVLFARAAAPVTSSRFLSNRPCVAAEPPPTGGFRARPAAGARLPHRTGHSPRPTAADQAGAGPCHQGAPGRHGLGGAMIRPSIRVGPDGPGGPRRTAAAGTRGGPRRGRGMAVTRDRGCDGRVTRTLPWLGRFRAAAVVPDAGMSHAPLWRLVNRR